MKNVWSKISNVYQIGEASDQLDKLPIGIYRIDFNEAQRVLYLSRTADEFSFPKKIYGSSLKFVNRVVKTYNSTDKNLGILLNGVKGTGKTVDAQLICQQLQLPVLIIHKKFDDGVSLPAFLNNIQQDIILFFDEYEKIYGVHDHSILTIMDGSLNSIYRKVFLLTTNDIYINENMMQRPSRIRYIKHYRDLDRETIDEIVDDLLINKAHKDKLITYLSCLEIITVDIIKSVIEEVNIHDEEPSNFKNVFNTKNIENKFKVSILRTDESPVKEEVRYQSTTVIPVKITSDSVGEEFYIGGSYIGEIVQFLDNGVIVIDNKDNYLTTWKIEPLDYRHASFRLTY